MPDLVRIGVLAAPGLYRHGVELTFGLLDYARTVQSWAVTRAETHMLDGSNLSGAVVHVGTEAGQHLAQTGFPAVNVSNRFEDQPLPSVLNDDVEVGRAAGRYLVEKGYRRILFDGIPSFPYSDERFAGLREIAEAAGVRVALLPKPDEDLPDQLGAFTEILRAVLSDLILPIAAVGCDDRRATRLARVSQTLGFRVPDDIAVMGVDNDILQCRMTEPELSSVETDAHRIGYEAGRLLDQLMQGQPEPEQPIRIPPVGVVERRSTDAFAIDDPMVVDGIRWFRDHVSEGVNVADAVRALNVPRRSFETRFKNRAGQDAAG